MHVILFPSSGSDPWAAYLPLKHLDTRSGASNLPMPCNFHEAKDLSLLFHPLETPLCFILCEAKRSLLCVGYSYNVSHNPSGIISWKLSISCVCDRGIDLIYEPGVLG